MSALLKTSFINLQKTTQLNFLLKCIFIVSMSPDQRLELHCARTVQTQSEYVTYKVFETRIKS